jgi:protein-disulfide isomerase
VLKEFPILGEQSVLTSQFAIAVRLLHGDDAYKKVHDALIAMRGDATDETLSRLAAIWASIQPRSWPRCPRPRCRR